ncbi:hypothetical protein ACFX2F_047267 [Malus domestica]
MQILNVAVSGEDSSNMSILPSGFMISRDGRPEMGDASGSLLTVAFHILVSIGRSRKQLRLGGPTAANQSSHIFCST